MLKQKTLKDSFSLSGKGLHTGLDMDIRFSVSTWKVSLLLTLLPIM